jgi:hypothetical protein
MIDAFNAPTGGTMATPDAVPMTPEAALARHLEWLEYALVAARDEEERRRGRLQRATTKNRDKRTIRLAEVSAEVVELAALVDGIKSLQAAAARASTNGARPRGRPSGNGAGRSPAKGPTKGRRAAAAKAPARRRRSSAATAAKATTSKPATAKAATKPATAPAAATKPATAKASTAKPTRRRSTTRKPAGAKPSTRRRSAPRQTSSG